MALRMRCNAGGQGVITGRMLMDGSLLDHRLGVNG